MSRHPSTAVYALALALSRCDLSPRPVTLREWREPVTRKERTYGGIAGTSNPFCPWEPFALPNCPLIELIWKIQSAESPLNSSLSSLQYFEQRLSYHHDFPLSSLRMKEGAPSSTWAEGDRWLVSLSGRQNSRGKWRPPVWLRHPWRRCPPAGTL